MAEEEKKTEQAAQEAPQGDSFRRVYSDATYFVDGMVKEYSVFPMILGLMRDGKATLELKKRYVLRAIDETWVNIIEDTIPCLDVLIRNPSKFIEEREEVMPIELSRNISVRSLQHLSQHTNLISKVEGDKITPSKILNVFREETIQTYENKFLNTLINRLYTFVSRRYEIAKKAGQDEKITSLEFNDDFVHEDLKVKMQFKMEISESTEGLGEKVEKNFTYTTDLWRRVEKLYNVVSNYTVSEFVQNMGHSYIRPPVMRTNAILKNKNLRQCLALWQFIESYEAAGYSMLVQEDLEKVDDEYVRELYSTLAIQYLIFRHNIHNEFDTENIVATTLTDAELRPQFVSDTGGIKDGEFDIAVPAAPGSPERRQPLPSMVRYGTLTPEDKMMLEALDAALEAAEFLRTQEPKRPPIPEPEPEEDLFAEEAADAAADSGEKADSGQQTADSEEETEEKADSGQQTADSEEERAEETAAEETAAEETTAEEVAEEPAEEVAEETAETDHDAEFAAIVASVAEEVASEAAEEETAVSEEETEEKADSGQQTADSEEERTEEAAVEETAAEETAEETVSEEETEETAVEETSEEATAEETAEETVAEVTAEETETGAEETAEETVAEETVEEPAEETAEETEEVAAEAAPTPGMHKNYNRRAKNKRKLEAALKQQQKRKK